MKKSLKSMEVVLQRLLYVLSIEQKRYGLLVLIASFIGALLETFGVSVIVPLINSLLKPESLLQEKVIGDFLKKNDFTEKNEIVIVVGGGIIAIYILKNLYFVFLSWLRAKYSAKIKRELSVKMIRSYMEKGYTFFLSKNSGELIRSVVMDTNGVYALLNQIFKSIVEGMTIVLICMYILITDWIMAVGMIAMAGLCLAIIYGGFRKLMGKQGEQSRIYNAIINQQAIQIFQGIKEIIVKRKQNYFADNFEDANAKSQRTIVWNMLGGEWPAYIIEAICVTGMLGLICIRVAFGGDDAADMLPALSALAVGAFRILPSLGRISSGFNTIIFYVPTLDDMYEQFKRVTDESRTDMPYDEETGVTGFENELILRQVSWTYGKEQNYILKNINLRVKKGEAIALIGQSGAGKTTLADIMLGLLKPQRGEVTLDGKDIFMIGKEWSRIVGYVPQTVHISDDSIRVNIAFGMPEEEIDDNKVWQALEQAQLKDFVQSLEKGIDTIVGERGLRFSGGQRQRVAIARALYEEPDILILDEATAALDGETENAVMEAIENLHGKITLVIVAHRLTTIRKCDKIYEVKDGQVYRREKSEVF